MADDNDILGNILGGHADDFEDEMDFEEDDHCGRHRQRHKHSDADSASSSPTGNCLLKHRHRPPSSYETEKKKWRERQNVCVREGGTGRKKRKRGKECVSE